MTRRAFVAYKRFGHSPSCSILVCGGRASQFGAVLLALGLFATSSFAQSGNEACGNPFQNHFGPWDYRSAPPGALANVERNHFDARVEALIRGVTTGSREIAADVKYTLRVFPNHHRALLAMARLADRHKTDTPPGADISVDCWFDRAIRFRPEDTVTRLLYAQYLGNRQRREEALRHLDAAQEAAADNPLSHYNIGLVAFELGDHQRALAAAHRARALGLPRQELEERLRLAGKWSEPE